MLIGNWGRSKICRLTCAVCGGTLTGVGSSLGVCPECIRDRWPESHGQVEAIHTESRLVFQLPAHPPRHEEGLSCSLCMHQCRMRPDEPGYCGSRTGTEASLRHDGKTRAKVSFYYDLLPTNCVADWVCPGGTGAGYPVYARDRGAEVGYYNLAVFFETCTFNCLYCQNWTYRKPQVPQGRWHSIGSLVDAVTDETSCICYFGGDPTPQVPYAVRVSEQVRKKRPDQVVRICWETNGSVDPAWLKRMAGLSLGSGGCVKFDLKAWNPNIHRALCGFDNRHVLKNFSRLAKWVELRPDPPLLVASTLMVPGYVDEAEVFGIASFIARLNPDIPYALLAFAPQFYLEDFPTTSRAQAEACLEAAKQAGLRRVRLGNRHLIQ